MIDSENGEWYFAGTIGMGFTFVTGITFNLEYSHEGDGYNSSEWRDISHLIDINVKEWRSGVNQGLGRGNLMTLNKVLRSQTLRKNYLFSRIFFPNLLDEHTSFEGTVLHSLDDFSGVFSLRTETEIGRLPTFGLYASTFYGGSDSEFGLRSSEFTFGGYVTFNF